MLDKFEIDGYFTSDSWSDYSLIAITEAGGDDDILNSEFIDTPKYPVFRSHRNYLISGMTRDAGVRLAVDPLLNPIDLDIKKFTEFINLHLINIVGVKIKLNILIV